MRAKCFSYFLMANCRDFLENLFIAFMRLLSNYENQILLMRNFLPCHRSIPPLPTSHWMPENIRKNVLGIGVFLYVTIEGHRWLSASDFGIKMASLSPLNWISVRMFRISKKSEKANTNFVFDF